MDTKALEVMDAFTVFEAFKKGEIDYKDFDWWVDHVTERAYDRGWNSGYDSGRADCEYNYSMADMVDPDSGYVK